MTIDDAFEQLSESYLELEMGPFPYTVRVVVSDDIEQSRVARNDLLGYYEADGSTGALYSTRRDGVCYLFLPYNCRADWLAHECFHAVWWLMEYIGAKHENEVMAYSLGYLVGEITKHNIEVSQTRWTTTN